MERFVDLLAAPGQLPSSPAFWVVGYFGCGVVHPHSAHRSTGSPWGLLDAPSVVIALDPLCAVPEGEGVRPPPPPSPSHI